MSTANATVLQLHHREAFERNVTRALAAGAGAGALAFLTSRMGVPVPLSFLAIAATALAAVRGDKLDRLMLAAGAVIATAAPWLFGFSHAWTIALSGAAAGALMVRARLSERGVEGQIAADRPGALHYGLASGATAGLAVAGFEVARVLGTRLADIQAPPLLQTVVGGVVVALFTGIGGITAHLFLKADPVEARCEELIPRLSGDFHTQSTRALALYRQCGESLQVLPREPAREELSRTIQKLTRDAVELAAEWTGVETQIEDEAQRSLVAEVADLKKSAAEAKDPVARRQLQMAASSLEEELGRLGELKLKRERILARLKSQVAVLERARVALIGMRSGQAHVKGAELTALSRKLGALAGSQADDAKLAHEVATSADLAALEVEAGRRTVSQPVMEAIAPVTAPVTAPPAEAQAAAVPATDVAKN